MSYKPMPLPPLPPGLGVPGIPGVNTAPGVSRMPQPQQQGRSPFLDPRVLDMIGQVVSRVAGGGYGNIAYNETRQRGLQNQMKQQQLEEDRRTRERQEQRQQEQLGIQKKETELRETELKGRQTESARKAALDAAEDAAMSQTPYESLDETTRQYVTPARYKGLATKASQASEIDRLTIDLRKRQNLEAELGIKEKELATALKRTSIRIAAGVASGRIPAYEALDETSKKLLTPEDYAGVVQQAQAKFQEEQLDARARKAQIEASVASAVRARAEAKSAEALAAQRQGGGATGQPSDEDYLKMALALVNAGGETNVSTPEQKVEQARQIIPQLKQMIAVLNAPPGVAGLEDKTAQGMGSGEVFVGAGQPQGQPQAPQDLKGKLAAAKIGDVIDTPKGRVRKTGPDEFEPVS